MIPPDAHTQSQILVVEDNPADVEITLRAFDMLTGIPHNLQIVRNGEAALRYVQQTGEFAHVPPADLILLDLNLPGIDGRDVLQRIKSMPACCECAVLILSSSSSPLDIRDAYELQANSYLTKPLDFHEFVQLLSSVCDYWLTVLPRVVTE